MEVGWCPRKEIPMRQRQAKAGRQVVIELMLIEEAREQTDRESGTWI
jgi:hypothetical protein